MGRLSLVSGGCVATPRGRPSHARDAGGFKPLASPSGARFPRTCAEPAPSVAALACLAVGVRVSRGPLRRGRAARCAAPAGDLAWPDLLDALQGRWEDSVGLSLEVSGDTVRFGDGTGSWKIEVCDGLAVLRGTRFVGTPEDPAWMFPNGRMRLWTRPRTLDPEELEWMEVFRKFKHARSQLRKQLWASVVAEEYEQASQIQAAWTTGSSDQLPSDCPPMRQARLAAGRQLVPGVCVSHKLYGYRGVIIGCEPWCNATAAWRELMGVAKLPRGETQPFYHCLADERDRPGGQITFVAEENVEPSDAAFEVEHYLVQELLVPCDELRGYLPSPRLDSALQKQWAGEPFNLELLAGTD